MSQPEGGASETEESQSLAETRLLMFFPNTLELYFNICIFAPKEMLFVRLTGHKFMSRNFFLSLFTTLGSYF